VVQAGKPSAFGGIEHVLECAPLGTVVRYEFIQVQWKPPAFIPESCL
jgi:hypothetical protein